MTRRSGRSSVRTGAPGWSASTAIASWPGATWTYSSRRLVNPAGRSPNADARDAYRARISKVIGVSPDRVTLFAKGRVALFAMLRALDLRPGDEVIVPAFTCVAVPNAILYAGARPVYVDIDPARTRSIRPPRKPRSRRGRGSSSPRTPSACRPISRPSRRSPGRMASRSSMTARTDSAGGTAAGRTASRRSCRSSRRSGASRSRQGLGGFAIARDPATAALLRRLEEGAAEPTSARVALLRSLVFASEHAGRGGLFERAAPPTGP